MSTAHARPTWAHTSPVILRRRGTLANLRHRWATVRAKAPTRRQVAGTLAVWRTPGLTVGGLGSFVAAAWTTFGTGAAWAAAGAAMLYLESLVSDDDRP